MSAVENVIDTAHRCKVMEVYGTPHDALQYLVRYLLRKYVDCRMDGLISDSELATFRDALPSITVLTFGIELCQPNDVPGLLWSRSMVEYLCDDFPELIEMKYTAFIDNIDNNIAVWRVNQSAPIGQLSQFEFIQRIYNFHAPMTHYWWSIFESVRSIYGVSSQDLDDNLNLEENVDE